MDFTNTQTLLAAIKEVPAEQAWLRDRYFPTDGNTDIFNTNKVLVEYQNAEQKKLAPFVTPRKNGIDIARGGYEVHEFEPGNIAPKRALYIDDLERKGFGESLFSNLTPAARQAAIFMKDYQEIDQMITRREEAMAAEVLTTNKLTMNHYADKDSEYMTVEVKYYTEAANPAMYTPVTPWTASTKIFQELHTIIRMLTARGLPATDLIVGADVADILMQNSDIKDYLDNRRFNLGFVQPRELPPYVAELMELNVYGHKLTVYTYDNTYVNDAGQVAPYIGPKQMICTAPNCGHTAYGCVTQLEGGQFRSYAGKRVPHYVADESENTRSITITSKPLMMPRVKNPFVSGTVVA
jgi:hypothetical protein